MLEQFLDITSSNLVRFFPQKMTIWVCEVIRIATVCVWMTVDVKNGPAGAVPGQSAGPALRPNGGLPPVRVQFASLVGTPYVLFETRSLVVFPIRNAEAMAYGPQSFF